MVKKVENRNIVHPPPGKPTTIANTKQQQCPPYHAHTTRIFQARKRAIPEKIEELCKNLCIHVGQRGKHICEH